MTNHDEREPAVRFYDLQSFHDDIPLYERLVPSRSARVLDLGCGTGRVLIPLATLCEYIHGIELSPSMLDICHHKMQAARLDSAQAVAEQGDVTDFSLDRKFDLIIAPFRVFQALEFDEQVEGILRCMREHLAPGGTCVLTMFHPNRPPDRMRTEWVTTEEKVDWERDFGEERIVALDRRPRLDPDTLVLYPELVYRRYRGEEMIEEVVMPIVMRCWYPDQIMELLESHDFEIVNKWGGYHGEEWGKGTELVIQFTV